MNPVSEQLSEPQALGRAAIAQRLALVMVLAFASLAAVFGYELRAAESGQLIPLVAVTGLSTMVNIVAFLYGRQQRAATATYLMVLSLLVFCPVATWLVSGVGVIIGLCSLAAILMFSNLTLQAPQQNLVSGLGVLFGISLILFDTLYAADRLDLPLIQLALPGVAVVSILVFGYFVARQFAGYPLRTKLILYFVLIAILSVGAVAVSTNSLARNNILAQVSQLQRSLSERLAFETSRELENNVELLHATASQFEEYAARATHLHVGEEAEIRQRILALDERWRAADEQSLLVRGVLKNEVTDELREFQANFPHHQQLLVTDRYGALIAATDRTVSYAQAEQPWWITTMNRGRTYISQPEPSADGQTYYLTIVVPLFADDELVGLLHSQVDVTDLLRNIKQGAEQSAGTVDLRISQSSLLGGDSLTVGEISGLDALMGGSGEALYQGTPSLVSQQRVLSAPNGADQQAISELGWTVIAHRDLSDALAPIQQQSRVITLVALFITIVVGLLGLIATQRIAAPILSLAEVTRQVAEGDLAIQAPVSTPDEIGTLATSFNRMTTQLKENLASLERRVAERTADLEAARLISERRAQDLQSISEVSRTISTEQRLEILLPLVTSLVSERFDFYHTGIFFIDPTRQFAPLQAANSEGGKRMLARGHRLDLGTGIVGTVAVTGKPRIALDVGADAAFFNNPDLPETRSEMALPLNFRGVTIGVLDVQSTRPAAFTEADANTLTILADQIAIALENARLFGQTQQARHEAEQLYNQFLRTEWKTFLRRDVNIGYWQTVSGGRPLEQPIQNEEIRQALRHGRVVIVEGHNGHDRTAMAIPVQLRGQTLGVLNITAPRNRKWNPEEVNLAQAVSERLALALDNARLLEESQRRAAKEAKIGEVTAKIGASINMRNVLQTAVEELGRALPGSEILIHFQQSEEPGA